MKSALVVVVAASLLLVVFQIATGEWKLPEDTQNSVAEPVVKRKAAQVSMPNQAPHEAELQPELPDTYLTPSQATREMENRASKAIETYYLQHIEKDREFMQLANEGIITHVVASMTKDYRWQTRFGKEVYTGYASISLENPQAGREETVFTLSCEVDEASPRTDLTRTVHVWECGSASGELPPDNIRLWMGRQWLVGGGVIE